MPPAVDDLLAQARKAAANQAAQADAARATAETIAAARARAAGSLLANTPGTPPAGQAG